MALWRHEPLTAARVVRHSSAQRFLAGALPLLERDIAAYGGLVAWARGLPSKAGKTADPAWFWTVRDQSRVAGFGMQRAHGPVVIGHSDPGAAAVLAESLANRRHSVSGVIGSAEACAAFATVWDRLTGSASRQRFHFRNYTLTRVPAITAVPGTARPAMPGDIDLLVAWSGAFFDDVRVPDEKVGLRAVTTNHVAEGTVWIWHDGRPRASVGFVRIDASNARIVSVYAPPENRGRGYAKALTAHVAAMLMGKGCTRVHLTADCANPVANGLYASLGFRSAGEHFRYDFGPRSAPER